MESISPEPRNLTEAGHELGLAPSTVRQRILDGELEAERDGGRWIIYQQAIVEYREKRKYRPKAKEYRAPAENPLPVADLSAEDMALLEECGIRVQLSMPRNRPAQETARP